MAWISNNYGFEGESDVFLQKVSIHQLSPELSQVLIVGTVIAKQGARRIMSKKRKYLCFVIIYSETYNIFHFKLALDLILYSTCDYF